jgi:hypothetical protein
MPDEAPVMRMVLPWRFWAAFVGIFGGYGYFTVWLVCTLDVIIGRMVAKYFRVRCNAGMMCIAEHETLPVHHSVNPWVFYSMVLESDEILSMTKIAADKD